MKPSLISIQLLVLAIKQHERQNDVESRKETHLQNMCSLFRIIICSETFYSYYINSCFTYM
jgi:hypothetical protein